MFHDGHRDLLRRCSALSWPLMIGVNTDEFVRKYKGRAPHDTENTRMLKPREYGPVALHDGDTAAWLEKYGRRGGIIAVGSDWARKDYLGQLGVTQDWLDEHDLSVAYLCRPPDGPSTTKLMQ